MNTPCATAIQFRPRGISPKPRYTRKVADAYLMVSTINTSPPTHWHTHMKQYMLSITTVFVAFFCVGFGVLFVWEIHNTRRINADAADIFAHAGYTNLDNRPVSLQDNRNCGNRFDEFSAFTASKGDARYDVLVCINSTDTHHTIIERK